MAVDPSDGTLDDILHLEHVAVGPYCVFDSFQPLPNTATPTPRTPPDLLGADPKGMADPVMSSAFSYPEAMRPSWFTTAGEDMPLTAPSDDLAGANWNEFMAWDPNTSQAPDIKLSGPVGARKMDQQQSPMFDRRQDSPSNVTPTSVAMGNDAKPSFTFGDNVELPPAFSFDANVSSSPSSHDGQQQPQGNFYPMWQQQQQQQVTDGSVFHQSPVDPSSASAAPMQNMSSTSSLHQSQSPSSPHNGQLSSSSSQCTPEPAPENPKKRKSPTNDDDSAPNSKKEKSQPPKKTAHNMIEKRYRTNLNDKIAALRDSVPSLRVMSRGNGAGEEEDDPEDLEGLTPAHKLNKATVLSKATEYIRHLEKRNKRLQEEMTALKARIDNYEKMSIPGSMNLHGAVSTPDGNRYSEDPFTPSHSMSMSGPPQGMIPVPDHIAGLRQGLPSQGHYAPAYPQYSGSRPGQSGPPMVPGRRSSMMGKLMVGSLAGLMILEVVAETKQSKEEQTDRGLFALPFHAASILAPRVSLGATSAQIPLAKVLLIFTALFHIMGSWFDFGPKDKKKTAHTVSLAGNPSLALPVEMRQKAWLTSIQTVWVPRHNFWLEAAALAIKTVKLSARKIIGWDRYAFLTGSTREQEIARVKSWGIALDAQLTGGDAEISKSRLVLTLMASGTLPDTPSRLMLKALHIRVLLWELAHAGHGLSGVFDKLSAKLSRRYWNMARSEQKIAANLATKPESEAEPLPDHLAILLEKECDDVLVPSIVQRAYNLAWNRPIAEHTSADPAMDGVVEDFAISSPLDALAAWYSSYRLKHGLIGYLGSRGTKVRDNVKADLDLAVQTAPPTSQAQVRALVAQAVVLEDDTGARITAASKALPAPPPTSQSKGATIMNLVSSAPIATDVRKALTLAKCHMLIQSSHVSARHHAAFVVNNTCLPEVTTTLLSFVAAYKVLNHFIQDPVIRAQTSHGLERMASSLRIWVGHETGKQSGLGNKVRARIVSSCLDASKMLVGLADKDEVDPGYFSSSVKGDEAES